MNGFRRLRRPTWVSRPQAAIEVEIETDRPRVRLTGRADSDALPLVRQTLRALGQSIGADPHSLHDAELAVSEACSNTIRHAYRNGDGVVEVTVEVRTAELLASVRDRGRGIDPRRRRSRREGGLGLTIVDAIARDFEVHSERGEGTEVVMALPVDQRWPRAEPPPGGDSIAELVLRRLVAMAAAQSDYSAERLGDILVAVEAVGRHAPAHLTAGTLRARLVRGGEGIELRVGPFGRGTVALLLERADVPVYGSVIERVANRVRTLPRRSAADGAGQEELALLFAPTA
jgi:serine/threonine-protein kinase RsbW